MTDNSPAYVRPDFASDADLTHPWVAQWRIPLVTTTYPTWSYEVALVVPNPGAEFDLCKALWPSEEEAAVVGSYIDYRRNWYKHGYQQKMLERALDVDGGTNTVILVKQEVGWRYRMASFTMGGLYPQYNEPQFQAMYPPTREGLMALIIKINSITDCPYVRFMDWMEEHPDVWGEALPGAREAVAADKVKSEREWAARDAAKAAGSSGIGFSL